MTAWIIAAIYAAGVIITFRRIAPAAAAEEDDAVLGHTIGVLSAVLWPAIAIVTLVTQAREALSRRNRQ